MICKNDLTEGLRRLGLKQGDIVLLHSSLLSLGDFQGTPDDVLDAFFEVIGSEGTLIVPVFGALGILTETLKRRPGAVVSPCPVGTVAAVGAKAQELCRDHWKPDSCHGYDTPYYRIAEQGGYVCLLGADQDRNTTLHGIEAILKLPYLKTTPEREFTTPEGETIRKSWKYYPGPHRDFIGLDRRLREAGALKIERIGNAQVRLMPAAKLFELGLQWGAEDPAFVLCDNPACADCVGQRAAIFRARMSAEAFKLAASSRLAGRYVPEMIENLQRVGVDLVELDYVQGRLASQLPAEKLAAAVAEFAAAKITISGMRLYSVPADLDALLANCKAAGIKRLILPLAGSSGELAARAYADGMELDFYNTHESSEDAAAQYASLQSRHVRGGIAFNAGAFARAGENPFLRSYRVGRFIKNTRQLDVADCTWDGTPKPLARGNAEIKELISIFRCRNFSGYFVLGGGSNYPGSLVEAAADLIRLLEGM